MDENKARIAGYAWAVLNQSEFLDSNEIDSAVEAYMESNVLKFADYGEFEPIDKAFHRGVGDAMSSAFNYITPEDVASMKLVTPKRVRQILNDPALKARHFPSAIREGQSNASRWKILYDEAEAWQPARTGPKKKRA